ncbi:hypothetical protein [Luteolibacter marinus]|uniref:hypothetical protein n=1 Tax=Luteolibacter marinus TaxID=2776705 RepID=UPI001866032A|nr:hypothetical protein [Luteolibacter marinus]
MNPTILVPDETRRRIRGYQESIREGMELPGARLRKELGHPGGEDFTIRLLRTKKPLIFAESAVAGDGSDWNATELSLLGDISVAMDVRVFDDGRHSSPAVHVEALEGSLVFVPGALLRSGGRCLPADWDELVDAGGELMEDAYDALYERRLLPGLQWINRRATAAGIRAFVTVPGLGCGQFAGPFTGRLEAHLERALERLLEKHAASLPAIRAVLFDPYLKGEPSRKRIGLMDFIVSPLTKGGKPQLAVPGDHGEEFDGCRLCSFVAWDHVSWPGNDYFGGSRATDDGVKAAATSSMEVVTGIAGSYNPGRHVYLPPAPYATWGDLVRERGIRFPESISGATPLAPTP